MKYQSHSVCNTHPHSEKRQSDKDYERDQRVEDRIEQEGEHSRTEVDFKQQQIRKWESYTLE